MSRAFGPYLLEDELGRGGMGVVYRARHAESGTLVALKVMTGSPDPETVQRLEREARVAQRLDHQGAVAPRATGVLQGRPYAVMELVTGETFAALLDRGALERGHALALVREVALVLAHAHERGVVHRDLKPANVMIDAQGRARVLDFGLALASGERSLTETGLVVGTPSYLSPEQARGDKTPVGPPADVYALGGMLYRILAGQPPFRGDALTLLRKVLVERPVPVRTLDPTIPRLLDDLVLRCLEKDPARRPRAIEVARALEGLATAKEEAGRRPPYLLAGAVAASLVFAGAAAWSLRAPRPVTPPPLAPPPAALPVSPPVPPTLAPPPPVAVSEEARTRAHDLARDAIAAMDRHDPATAWQLAHDALELDPREPVAHVIEGERLWTQGSFADGQAEMEKGIALDPDRWEGHFYLAQLLLRQQDRPGAVREMTEAVRTRPGVARPIVLRGIYYLELDDLANAKKDLEAARILNPTGPGVAELEGLIALEEKDYERARAAFTRQIERERKDSYGWGNRARADMGLGDLDAALSDALTATSLHEEDADSRDTLSRVHEARGELDAAIHAAEEACRLQPGTPKWENHLARLRAAAR